MDSGGLGDLPRVTQLGHHRAGRGLDILCDWGQLTEATV